MTDAVNRETPPARGHETIGDWLGDHWDHTTHAVSTGIEHLAGHDTATPPAAAAITTSAETAAASPAITQETNVNLTEFRQIAERVENIGEETITTSSRSSPARKPAPSCPSSPRPPESPCHPDSSPHSAACSPPSCPRSQHR